MAYSNITKWLKDSEEASRRDEAKAIALAREKAEKAQANVDQGGLHSAAERGHTALVAQLINKGAYVDYPNEETGRTSMHVAVKGNHIDVVKLLLLHGADINIKDKDGLMPGYFCKSNQMNGVLGAVNKQAQGNCRGDITVDSVGVQRGKTTKLKNVDMAIQVPSSLVNEFTYTCRRQTVEFSDVKFDILADDEICSDVFVQRVTGVIGKVQPILTVPLFCEPNYDEVLVFKPDNGKYVVIKDIFQNGDKWYCKVQENIAKVGAFVMLTRKRKEIFDVGRSAAKVVSNVDRRVVLDIPENTFQDETKLTLEISEPPIEDKDQEDEEEEDKSPETLSCTSFYSLNCGSRRPAKPINVTVPVPETFTGNNDNIRILTMNDDEEDENEDSWEFLDIDTAVDKGGLKFDLTSFSVKVAVERKPLAEGDELVLKSQISQLYRASRRRIHSVVFLVMVMPLGYTRSFKIVVECCLDTVVMERKAFWETEGFEDQHPSITAPFTSISKQCYMVTMSSCFRMSDDNQSLVIEFHAKRQNYQIFCAEVVDPRSTGIGHVQIEQLQPSFLRNDTDDKGCRQGFFLTNIVVELRPKVPPQQQGTDYWISDLSQTDDSSVDGAAVYKEDASCISVLTVNTEDTDGQPPDDHTQQDIKPDFMGPDYLLTLFGDVGEDWFRIFIFLGISFRQIDKRLTIDLQEQHQLNNLLLKWQKKASTKREDRGVRLLLSALKMGGRLDLRIQLLVDMKQWYDGYAGAEYMDSLDKPFYGWIANAYGNPEILDPSGYPKPMSDQSLILIAGYLMPSYELAKGLGLSKAQLDGVMSNSQYSSDEMKVMKLLQMFMEQVPNQVKALKLLLRGLNKTCLSGARDYFVMMAQAWMRRSAGKDNPTLQKIYDVLKESLTKDPEEEAESLPDVD